MGRISSKRCPIRPLHYFRFLDDVCGFWTHIRQEFDTFLHNLNHHNSSINFKATADLQSVDFLDTTTFKVPNQLDIKVCVFFFLFVHVPLFKMSHHPKHTYSGIVKSHLLSFHRICTREDDFRKAIKLLFQSLTTREGRYSAGSQTYCCL